MSGDSNDQYKCKCIHPILSDTHCCPETPQKIIQKLVTLIYDPISTDLYDRQILLLDKFLSASTYAYWLHDLPYVIKLLEHLFKQINILCLFRRPLKCLLSLSAMRPLLAKHSDILQYSRDLDQYFTFLGYLLVEVEDVELRNLIVSAILNLLDKQSASLLNCITQQTCFNCVERSHLPYIVGNLLEFADTDLYTQLLDISWILVNISVRVCQKMIKEKAIDHILVRMKVTEENSSSAEDVLPCHYEISCRLLWSLLQACKSDTKQFHKNQCGPSEKALRSLQGLLRVLTNKKDQINRNYIMAILLQCLDLFPNLAIISSGLASDIGVLCAATEFGTGGTWISSAFGTSETDYEFKKMVILAVCYCAKIPSAFKIVHPKRAIPSLLRVITPELSKLWLPQQQTKLVSLALTALQMLAQVSPNDFLNADGPIRLLMMIDYFVVQPYDLLLLRDCLKSLDCVVSVKNQDVISNIMNNGGCKILMDICNKLLSLPNLSLNSQQCMAYAFCTLETLCSVNHKYFTTAVHLCIAFLQRVLNPKPEDPVYNPNLLICGIDFLWSSTVWIEENLQSFTSMGGVYKLLDTINAFTFPVKVIGLAVLVDMCDAGSCIPHMITWRKNGLLLLPMLLDLFRHENHKIGVRSTYDSTIADIELPLMGQQQWYETFHNNKNPNSSPATIDLLGSCRPKIYAIIHLLFNRHEMCVAIANEHYKMFDTDDLKTIDKITLLLAENYLALKLGETWVEVIRDIEKSGILPLAIDEDFMVQLMRRFHKWGEHIKIAQEKLLEKKFITEYNREMDLYNLLRESKLIESLHALHELSYIARTTERMFRLTEKMNQCNQIEHNQNFTEGADHHTTYMYKLRATPVFLQQVSIQSNIVTNQNDLDMVSLLSESETDINKMQISDSNSSQTIIAESSENT